MASAVALAPVPATTGTRPSTRRTTDAITCLCSAWVSVADSPVVPTGTMPCVPDSKCQSTKLSSAAQSMAPDAVIGVTKATKLPLKSSVACDMVSPRDKEEWKV